MWLAVRRRTLLWGIVRRHTFCKSWASHSGNAETRLISCYILSTGKYAPTFRRILVFSFSGSSNPKITARVGRVDCLSLKVKGLPSFETSIPTLWHSITRENDSIFLYFRATYGVGWIHLALSTVQKRTSLNVFLNFRVWPPQGILWSAERLLACEGRRHGSVAPNSQFAIHL
jgi:hypothetical protein